MATPSAGYRNADDKRISGVTTILGRFKDSGGLMHWAFKQGQEGKSHLYEQRDVAAVCGTLAHEMVEAWINGENYMQIIVTAPLDVGKQALNAFQMFREWHDNSKIEIISKYQEIQMVSEKYQYGGTPDAIGRNANGELVLIDWKTSNGVYSDYGLQLAAYKNLWEENGNEPITGGFHLCRFSKDFPDFAHHYYGNLDLEWQQFKAYVICYNRDKEIRKRYK